MPHILLVDGSLSVRVNLQHALMTAGFQVTACDGCASARKVLRRQAFSLILINASLPDGDGEALLRETHQDGSIPKTPIILIPAEGDVNSRLRALGAGASDCIGKPIGPAFLVKRARQLLNMTPASGTGSVIGSHNPARVLLVDDSETFLNAFADRLRAEGHDVVLAKSGTEALTFLDAQSVDGVVLDLFMPGLNGVETCRRIRSTPSTASVPIMLLTGREDTVVRAAGIAAGVDDYVVKSADLTALAVRLGEMLRRKPGELRAAIVASKGPDSPRGTARLSALLSMAATNSAAGSTSTTPMRPPEVQDRITASSTPPPPPPSSPGSPDSGRFSEGPPSGPYSSPLFEQALMISGLQHLIGRGCLKRAFDRAGVDPRTLTPEGLSMALPEIKQTLAVFLPKDEAERHAQAISALARKSSQSSATLAALRDVG